MRWSPRVAVCSGGVEGLLDVSRPDLGDDPDAMRMGGVEGVAADAVDARGIGGDGEGPRAVPRREGEQRADGDAGIAAHELVHNVEETHPLRVGRAAPSEVDGRRAARALASHPARSRDGVAAVQHAVELGENLREVDRTADECVGRCALGCELVDGGAALPSAAVKHRRALEGRAIHLPFGAADAHA